VIPKSDKLAKEDSAKSSVSPPVIAAATKLAAPGPVVIRKVDVCNDFVAVVQFQLQTGSIELPDSSEKYMNEGMVVGLGPGVVTGPNKDLLHVGDVVMFGAKNILTTIDSNSPPYKDRKVIIVSERNVLCKLSTIIDWEEYDENA